MRLWAAGVGTQGLGASAGSWTWKWNILFASRAKRRSSSQPADFVFTLRESALEPRQLIGSLAHLPPYGSNTQLSFW
jgi:hypothetical protein